MRLSVSTDLADRFPGLQALVCYIEGVEVTREKSELEQFKLAVHGEIRSSYNLKTLKDDPIFRAYRDFYWRAGIDPTKTRPSGEALVRRILSGKALPKINTLADAYNLASARTGIAIGAFDLSKVRGGAFVEVCESW